MAVSLTVAGISYSYPQTGDTNWGTGATGWAQGMTGLFTGPGILQATSFPAMTGDVTSVAGALATTVAAIHGNTVSGTTGTGNVAFSASPTFTGTIVAAALTLSTALPVTSGGTGVTTSTGSGNVVLSASPTFTGTITAAALTLSSALGISYGGTGQTSAAAAITALAGSQTSGFYLRSNGTNTLLAAIVAGDVPTLNQNTTGTAAGLSTPLVVASGGTGQTTANTGFNALSPMTTGGDLIYGGASGAATRLANGSNGQVLTSAGGTSAPAWGTVSVTPTAVLSKSSNYTLGATDDTVVFTAAATATLPTAVGASGKRYTVINGDTTAANITIDTTSSQTIGGRASGNVVLKYYGTFITVESDGSNWQIVAKYERSYLFPGTSNVTATLASGDYYQALSSVTLGIGLWNVTGWFTVTGTSTTAAMFLDGNSGFYGADGANSSSAPTAVSHQVDGYGGVIGYPAYVTGATGQSIAPFNGAFSITSGTYTVYLVPQIKYTTSSGSEIVSCTLTAERLF